MRRMYLHSVILSFLIILFANKISFSQNAIITGKVRYGKEAVPSATVSLEKKTTLTNQNGEFSFSVQPGTYTLIITHVSYKKIQHTITVDAGSINNFEIDMIPNEQLGEIVMLGSRSLVQRSNLNTPVPVDAFTSAQLEQTGQTSLVQMLNFTAPSLNASLQNAFEPITLRGLYPDQVLILLNGARYSSSAHMNNGVPRGQLGRGSVTNDLNSIPYAAVEKIEILRDGASAQYGSDAIAGVINIILKEATGKTSVNLHLGQQYKGDGEHTKLGIYHGIALNKRGFLNCSADFSYRKPTFRGGAYLGTVYFDTTNKSPRQKDSLLALDQQKIKDSGFDRMQASNAGNSKLTSFGILMNGAYQVNSKTKIFWTGAMNKASFTFVFPYTFSKVHIQVNDSLFPNGFKGRVIPGNWNVSGIAGAKGLMGKGIHWEYSSAYGMNSSRFNSENTNNASQQFELKKNAPTKFYTGTYIDQQLTNTIHFIKNIINPQNKLKTMNLDWGAELRFENFRMKAGEEASWNNYDSLGRKLGAAQTSLVVSPRDALDKSRSVMCTYVDFEVELKDRFLLDLASRFEHYSDFGSNLAGKLAARYKFGDILSIRGSVSNGFRAPSMQQRYWGAIYSGFIRGGSSSIPQNSGVFNNEHIVTKLFGVPSLEAEKSLNMSGGLTSAVSRHIYLTVDVYWIQIKNRVVLSGGFNRNNNPEVDSLLKDPSLNDYPTIVSVAFFSNAINTRTQGVDAVLYGKWNFNKAQLIAIASANFTRTHVYGDIKTAANLSTKEKNKSTLFNEEQKTILEEGQPRTKVILSLNYKIEKIGLMLRNTCFGETAFQRIDNKEKSLPRESFSSKTLTDFSISYTPKSWLTVTAGANNIFDVYPDRIKNYENTSEGMYLYATEASPFGYNGGYYYIGTSLNF